MYEDENWIEFKNGLTIGLGIGLLTGVTAALFTKRKQQLAADDVLKKIKQQFLKEGPIEGSWINFEKKPIRKFAIHTEGYSGGITRLEDERLITYEFLADANTGSVLDIKRTTA